MENGKIKEYIKKKKRKKRNRKIILVLTLVVITTGIFLLRAPIFNIQNINITGVSKLSSEALLEQLELIKGRNLFLQNENEIKSILLENRYVEEVDVRKSGINSIDIIVREEAPVYYIVDSDVNKILNESLEVIEISENIEGRNLVELKGITYEKSELGDVLSTEESYILILEEFYPYIAYNRQEIKLDWLDISNIVDINGRIGEIDIYFGHYSDLYYKMETIYDIVLSTEIKMESGYIDVSFDGAPVIKNTTE